MEFKIDRRYVAIQTLKGVVAYLVALFIVLFFLHTNDPEGFIGITLIVGIGIYIYQFPKKIYVEDGAISFVSQYSNERIKVGLNDIISIENVSKSYNSLKILTRFDNEYTLHPADIHELEDVLSRR